MKRDLNQKLIEWKNSQVRKPLIIQGARQVGKTWLMKNFGEQNFEKFVYLNFESSTRLKDLFIADYNIERIIATIEIETNQKIDSKNTLLIFDEIQEADKGLTALKYFCENAPEYYIVAAGSLLGVSMQKKHSFPVGKVDFLSLYPMSFTEFLESNNESRLAAEIKNANWDLLNSFHDRLVEQLRLYYYIGGMPEAIYAYIQNKNLEVVREIQDKILLGYANDFAKYAPNKIVPKIKLVWNSIISQLSKENKKFIYGQIKKGGRAKEFELAIAWLVDAGLILKINNLSKPELPLNAYAEFDNFKLYFLDIGLLNAMGGLEKQILLEKNAILTEFKGALTEQYVCQQLFPKSKLFYWSAPAGNAEIDFVFQKENQVIPLEVKAEENLKAKSLKVFVDKFENKNALRTSMSKFRKEDWLTNIPLFAAESIA
ncbi:ATP-binding protein [Lacihabitans sp. CCS-44]|uniref:ATP-binding protein n=1 Tax=Lacihabitans sp. CCS-44 TaxID=2487331 RepID=UPI0020CE1688|nr:ATP-binding protein [Lacihabitans sp. CCS-44]MCP9756133.1 ATP-binding protein [Lacihabitans sp. CCS-44]